MNSEEYSLNKINLTESTFNTQRTHNKVIIRKTKLKLLVKFLHWAWIPQLKIIKSKSVLIHKKQSRQKISQISAKTVQLARTGLRVCYSMTSILWIALRKLSILQPFQVFLKKNNTQSKQIWLAHANKLENNNLRHII